MTKSLGRIVDEIIPLHWGESPQDHAKALFANPDFKRNVAVLTDTAQATSDPERLKEFRDIAKGRYNEETTRQASIMSRAQGLLIVLAFFGALAAFGTSLLTATAQISPWLLWLCFVCVAFIVLQMAIMVFNTLAAIRGIHYPVAGSSDFTDWLKQPDQAAFYRAEALLTLEHYRHAVMNNNWRFGRLDHALKGLRNIVLVLGILILALFASDALKQRGGQPLATQSAGHADGDAAKK
jgi:hypothetical protein